MTTMTATEFKAKCLEVLSRVQQTGETVQVTKWGKVVAEVVPPSRNPRKFSGPGAAKEIMWIVGDILEPLDIEWDALK